MFCCWLFFIRSFSARNIKSPSAACLQTFVRVSNCNLKNLPRSKFDTLAMQKLQAFKARKFYEYCDLFTNKLGMERNFFYQIQGMKVTNLLVHCTICEVAIAVKQQPCFEHTR